MEELLTLIVGPASYPALDDITHLLYQCASIPKSPVPQYVFEHVILVSNPGGFVESEALRIGLRTQPVATEEEGLQKCHVLVAFWDGKDEPTISLVKEAKKKGIPFTVHMPGIDWWDARMEERLNPILGGIHPHTLRKRARINDGNKVLVSDSE